MVLSGGAGFVLSFSSFFRRFQALRGLLEPNTNFKSALLDPALLATDCHRDQIPALLTPQKLVFNEPLPHICTMNLFSSSN